MCRKIGVFHRKIAKNNSKQLFKTPVNSCLNYKHPCIKITLVHDPRQKQKLIQKLAKS